MPDRQIRCSIAVPTSIEQVWAAWTSREGMESFFAPRCRVDLRPGGAYEPLFDLTAPPGKQGAEGMILLAIQRPTLLSFTWNAPPHLPDVRAQMTHVCVRLESLDERQTQVTLTHDGWGTGPQWDEAFIYFEHAWGKIVLPRLQRRFTDGPIDWSDRA